ncbi:hypothetical protein KZZ52_25775 [Dactylosporangium sp. AC04546]|uniref:hypothetical protein n=1 Tax=Dactylosporangium sp. AC04546 TaxID=2862460 RepID=UPI001EDF73ED|nr:hypothetical protein [Dactylosporangium sp. AC04546]WVK88681.1 hypothetical protein KZZ52_25775 [Dactylosporangium sp. AC04546]
MTDVGDFGDRRHRRGFTVAAGGISVAAVLTAVVLAGGHDGVAPAGPAPEPSVAYSGCAPASLSPSAVACVPRIEMTPSPDYGTTATPGVPPPQYNAAQIARLSSAFEQRLRAVAPPGTTFLDTRVNDGAAGPFQFAVQDDSRYAESFVVGPDLRDSSGTGNVVFRIGKPISALAPDGRRWPSGYGVGQFQACPDADCTQSTGPHGERIVAMPNFQHDGATRIARIDVTKIDGTGIVLEVRNLGLGNGEAAPTKRRPELPLTVEQMIEIATDPALTMTP